GTCRCRAASRTTTPAGTPTARSGSRACTGGSSIDRAGGTPAPTGRRGLPADDGTELHGPGGERRAGLRVGEEGAAVVALRPVGRVLRVRELHAARDEPRGAVHLDDLRV